MIAAAIRAANEGTNQRIEAAVRAATSGSATSVQQMKKPTLPAFDPKNIEIWLKRVNAAFDRLSITDPKLKFANLDEKIPSDTDPKINEFMWGTPSAARWDEFVAYLRKKHGRTTKQKAASVLEGTEREGRCPSQLWSVMIDRADDVTLDDIMKEQLLRRLPNTVKGHLQDRIKGKTGKEVADMADEYFDADGNEINKQSTSSGINAIRPALKRTTPSNPPSTASSEAPSFTTAFETEDDSDINAVRYRQGQKQSFDVRNRSASRGRSSNSSSSNSRPQYDNSSSNSHSSNRQNSNSLSNSAPKSNPKICHFHVKFGELAENCTDWCILKGKLGPPKGKANR